MFGDRDRSAQRGLLEDRAELVLEAGGGDGGDVDQLAVAITERQSMEFRFDAINAFNTPIFAVSGYATDVFPGGGIDKTKYGVDPTYTAGIPTGVVNSSIGSRNPQFALKYRF